MNEQIRAALRTVYGALKTDYANEFRFAFPDDAKALEFKRQMKRRLSAFTPFAIVDGYDRAAMANPKHMPTLPELAGHCAAAAEDERRQQAQQAQGSTQNDGAPYNPVGVTKIAQARAEAALRASGRTEEERKAALLEARRQHETILRAAAAAEKIKYPRHPGACGMYGCQELTEPGGMFCRAHDPETMAAGRLAA